MKYYIKDNTANTGRTYIDENDDNVSLQENAISFDTEAEALEHVSATFGLTFDQWGYVTAEA
jgi:hypothetical protein